MIRSHWMTCYVSSGTLNSSTQSLKPGFHYPSWRPEVTGFHYPSTRPVLTGNGNRSPVNSSSGNRALLTNVFLHCCVFCSVVLDRRRHVVDRIRRCTTSPTNSTRRAPSRSTCGPSGTPMSSSSAWQSVIESVTCSQARFPFKRNRLRWVRCVNENRKKRRRLRWQAANHDCHCFGRAFLLAGACVCCVKIMRNFTQQTQAPANRNARLGRSSGNHDWLLANASVCVSCGFRLRNASDCVWMETGL